MNWAYSCASLTSPVIAEKPRYGFGGSDMPLMVKQSDQSSPVIASVSALNIAFQEFILQPLYWTLTYWVSSRRHLSSMSVALKRENNAHIQNRVLHIDHFQLGGHIRPSNVSLTTAQSAFFSPSSREVGLTEQAPI